MNKNVEHTAVTSPEKERHQKNDAWPPLESEVFSINLHYTNKHKAMKWDLWMHQRWGSFSLKKVLSESK